jgi:hypothetical protein
MNERIEYHALMARQYASELHPNALDMENWAKVYHEKFAELIVRECAKVADLADENKCEWIGGNILTHFGIEE